MRLFFGWLRLDGVGNIPVSTPPSLKRGHCRHLRFPNNLLLLQAWKFTAKDPCLVSDMDAVTVKPTYSCHVVAIPYPGRGHVNPLMNFCNILASKKPDTLITFVVTEEWLGFISSSSNSSPSNLQFGSIPNVIPSELVRNAYPIGFIEATLTKDGGSIWEAAWWVWSVLEAYSYIRH